MKDFLQSARLLLVDLASTFAFLILLLLTHNVPLSIVLGMALGVVQIAWDLVRKQPIGAMQWMSFLLVIGFGAASLLTHDPRFVMAKPSVIYLIVGVVMLKPGWMIRYVPDDAKALVSDLAFGFGYVWAALMFVSAGIVLFAALTMKPLAWAGFVSIWGAASKAGLFLAQYAIMRRIGRRRYVERQAAVA